MKYLKLFEEMLSPQAIADKIQDAVGGLGTDEDHFASAVKSILSKPELYSVNSILSNGEQYSYKTVESAVDGELGWLDSEIKTQILNHLQKISSIIPDENPLLSKDPIILSIIDRVTFHEGYHTKVYYDSVGVPTIGVGFNLTRKDAPKIMKKIGANLNKIKSGKAELTKKQVTSLLHNSLTQAKTDCLKIVKNFNSLPSHIQGVLIELSFALGINRFLGFKRFLLNIQQRKFKNAAKELLTSKWAKQVGNRANTLAGILNK
jgi:lysozyme